LPLLAIFARLVVEIRPWHVSPITHAAGASYGIAVHHEGDDRRPGPYAAARARFWKGATSATVLAQIQLILILTLMTACGTVAADPRAVCTVREA
jgi:hypothetical protein